MSRTREAVVIGGGLAGAAVAKRLGEAGRDVVLIEREPEAHDKVCGEFLSFEAVHYLRRLGIDPPALGAVPIEAVSLAAGGPPVAHSLPFPAFSLSRRRLDEALLRAALDAGAEIQRGQAVRSLIGARGAWEARLADGETIAAREAFLATGKHDLRGWKRPPGRQNDLVGLKLHLRLEAGEAAALGGRVELLLFPGGYGGLEPVEDGQANLCLLVRKERFAREDHAWETLLDAIREACPHLARRLRDAAPVQNRPLAVAAIPYGLVRRSVRGCWALGDQAAVIPSFSGDGMSIALHSAFAAADHYLSGGGPEGFQRLLAADVSAQVGRATLLSRVLVQGWAQRPLAAVLSRAPRLLALAARATRIRPAALRRTDAFLPVR